MAKLRKLFTDTQVKVAMKSATRADGTVDYKAMSSALSVIGIAEISPQLALYWAKQFSFKRKDGGDFRTLTQANRDIREKAVKLRKPNRYEDKAIPMLPETGNTSILVIPDLHAPYHHPDSLDFLAAVSDAFDTDTVVCLGDETDKHAMSFHDSDPNLDSAGLELEKSRAFLKQLHNLFPVMRVCHSNHGSMHFRKAKAHGLPVQYLRTYREVLFPEGGGEQWEWQYEFKLTLPDGQTVLFKHEPAGSAIADAAHNRCHLVTGHLHGKYFIEYAANSEQLYWALQGGCLIDRESLAFAYGKESKMKPIIGCSVIVDSLPILVPMRLNNHGRWIGSL